MDRETSRLRGFLERIGLRAFLLRRDIDGNHVLAALEQRLQHRLAERLLAVHHNTHNYAASARAPFSGAVIAPDALISAISWSLKPSSLRRISSVCSPNSGERFTSVIESDILIGLPTVRYLPRVGWSTSTTVPVLRSDGSSAISFIDRIGPTGMSTALQMSMTSNLVWVMK